VALGLAMTEALERQQQNIARERKLARPRLGALKGK
jgi:hypothetical protein